MKSKNNKCFYKNYSVTATLVTYYTKDIEFDSSDTAVWYKYDFDAEKARLTWADLSEERRATILSAFESDLENTSIELDDPCVYENCSEWSEDLLIDKAW